MSVLSLSILTASVVVPSVRHVPQRSCLLRMAVEESSSLTVTGAMPTTEASSAPTALEEQLREHASDPDDLRKTYRKLAATVHPDVSESDDALERFRSLSAEYQRLMRECKSASERDDLMKVWMGVLAAAAVAAVTATAAAAAATTTSPSTSSRK